MGIKIGEFLVSIGALTEDRVKEILKVQEAGDGRLFGEIAASLGILEDSALKRFTDFLSEHQEFAP
jgi:hypothetical protein